MAVLEMRKINICALKKDRKKILEFLQEKAVWKYMKLKIKTLFSKSKYSNTDFNFSKECGISGKCT